MIRRFGRRSWLLGLHSHFSLQWFLQVARRSNREKADLTVSAAISLKDALDEAKQTYIASNPNVTIRGELRRSGTLRRSAAPPVDCFLSAAPKQMDALETKALLLEARDAICSGNEVF